jgi:hypothetical protein
MTAGQEVVRSDDRETYKVLYAVGHSDRRACGGKPEQTVVSGRIHRVVGGVEADSVDMFERGHTFRSPGQETGTTHQKKTTDDCQD